MTTATPRRIAPTARLILPATADRDTWLAARRHHIGSSDVARILGIYPSPLRVWYDKRGQLPDVDNEQKLWGRKLEHDIADEWTRRNRSVTTRVGLVENVDNPLLACTLDRRVVECPAEPGRRNACALEVKLTSVFRASRWRRQIPDDVLAQVLHQCRVTGYDHMHVAALIGTYDYRQFTVWREREAEVFDFVAAEVDAFAAAHMPADTAPAPPGSDDVDLWDEVYPARTGVVHLSAEQTVEALEARDRYETAHAELADPTGRKREAKSDLLALTGDGEVVVAGDDLLWTYLEVAGAPKVDLDRLSEQFPDAYAACVKPTSHRTLQIAGRRRRKG
jgi:putative phage-type endonuclease